MINATRAVMTNNASLAKRCLTMSSICRAEKQVSLYKGMKSKEFIRQQEMAKRQNLVDAYIHVDMPLDVTPVTGVPKEHVKTRRVRIFKQAKNSMQSATFDTQNWKIEFETRDRWENPLMGWGSSGDPLSNMIVQFGGVEDAIAFCQKNGWDFHVDEPQVSQKPKLKSYAENFAWNKRTRIGSK